MSASCKFCGTSFANAQAVRAHLKGCAEYQAQRAERAREAASLREAGLGSASLGKQSLGIGAEIDSESLSTFDPVRQLQQQIETERLRLQLREVQEAHAEMDRRADAKAQERQQHVKEQADASAAALRQEADARHHAERHAEETGRLQAETVARRRRKREIIQSIKTEVMSWWFHGNDLKAQTLQEIERALSALPVEDLPHSELVEVASGIRDRFGDQALKAFQAQTQREQHRQNLKCHGQSYARQQLADVEGLNFSDRYRIERRINEALEQLGGNETTEQVEDLIEDIFDREGIGWDEDDDE